MQIRNLTNHTNPGAIIGNITSPLRPLAPDSSVTELAPAPCRMDTAV